ncbi:MAG: TetR/AcrR family transcriptional regulator [Chloroflexi bacterium]|nr:TetR/AcrR family transcriptional regulator [Chloroflexota bacterium]
MTQAATLPPRPEGRLARRKARTRAAIIAAAGDLFSVAGFEGTSMQQIADLADTGVGTLYGYFHSKEDVLREVLREHSAISVERYRAAVDDATPPLDRLCMAIETFAEYLRDHRTLLRAAINSPAGAESGDQPGDWVVHAFAQMITGGVQSGELRPVPAETAARALVSVSVDAMLGMGVWRGHEDDPGTIPALVAMARAWLPD